MAWRLARDRGYARHRTVARWVGTTSEDRKCKHYVYEIDGGMYCHVCRYLTKHPRRWIMDTRIRKFWGKVWLMESVQILPTAIWYNVAECVKELEKRKTWVQDGNI